MLIILLRKYQVCLTNITASSVYSGLFVMKVKIIAEIIADIHVFPDDVFVEYNGTQHYKDVKFFKNSSWIFRKY